MKSAFGNDADANRGEGVGRSGPVRHAEKRRNSTCRFADRIARFCVDHYREHVPLSFREEQKQTCLAAIVAFFKAPGQEASPESSRLYMLGMGVGTKFLSQDLLKQELELDLASNVTASHQYGNRVRDCHAEILARRAFRRQLALCMLQDLDSTKGLDNECPPILILERVVGREGAITYSLKSGVSLHMYSSSAPCGNATLKKFATMKKESFREDLRHDEWPSEAHEPILGHSIPLGQFALLVKKDPGASTVPPSSGDRKCNTQADRRPAETNPKKKPRECPARETTDWCPPGTSTVWSGRGSLHTCSDKICRWNYLGLQGSLLAALLEQPLYMSSLTVGRKLTECICRRAICCRAAAGKSKNKKKRKQEETDDGMKAAGGGYQINHPAIMGTAVYMDDNGVIESEDVRFHSTLSWAWWPCIAVDRSTIPAGNKQAEAECINGATGFVVGADDAPEPAVSRISTAALFDLHCRVVALIKEISGNAGKSGESRTESSSSRSISLSGLKEYKRQYSPLYETQKQQLLSRHPLFRQWRRREIEAPQRDDT